MSGIRKSTWVQGSGAQGFALAAVLAAEFALYSWATSRHFAWICPRWFDQIQYLRNAYDAYDHARAEGFLRGVHAALADLSPQGALHGVFALAAFTLAGPSRASALGVNMAAFLLVQVVTFAAARRVSGSYSLAWAAVGLLAALQVPWSGEPGSAADFRLDWISACLYGAALGTGVLGGGLRSTRWAVALGAAVGLVLLTRFLTAVYFCGIFAGLFAWLLTRRDRWVRCARLALSGLVAAGVSGWAFWRARHLLYAYYWVGHLDGPERALRDSHLTLASALAWLFRETSRYQLGFPAVALALGSSVALLASRKEARPKGAENGSGNPWRSAWPLVLLFLAAPSAVLLMHPEKSTAPLEIVVVPAVWVFVLLWVGLSQNGNRTARAWVGGVVAVLGLARFAAAQLLSPIASDLQEQYRDVNALSDYVYFRSEEAGMSFARVAVTWKLDGLGAESFELVGQERHGRRQHFIAELPTGIFAVPADLVQSRLSESDFVCLVTRARTVWPFDEEMTAMLPEMRRWCDANLRQVGRLDEREFSVVLYEKRTLVRAPEGSRADFDALLARGRLGPASAPAMPPAAPIVPTRDPILWPVATEVRYALKAAYSPLKLEAKGLPKGLWVDPDSGEIRGRFERAGEYGIDLVVTNALGSCTARIRFTAVDADFDAEAWAPARCRVGETVTLRARACDTSEHLDFVDFTDLTAVRVLGRIAVADDERRSWQGGCTAVFAASGPHTVLVRCVRYHPQEKDPYSFVDRTVVIEVTAGESGPP